MKKIFGLIKDVSKSFIRHNLHVYAGDMTYKLVLSIFPLVVFALGVIGFLGIDEKAAEMFYREARHLLPHGMTDVVESFLAEARSANNPALLSVSIISVLMALFSASSGFASIIKGINRCYGKEGSFFHSSGFGRRVLGILLTLLFVGIIIMAMAFMVVPGAGAMRFLLSVFAILVIVVAIYKLGSGEKIRIRDAMPGALVTVLGWVLLSLLFNVFVKNFGNLSAFYGSLSSVFIMLIWLNLITMVLLTGAEVNACLLIQRHRRSVNRALIK